MNPGHSDSKLSLLLLHHFASNVKILSSLGNFVFFFFFYKKIFAEWSRKDVHRKNSGWKYNKIVNSGYP